MAISRRPHYICGRQPTDDVMQINFRVPALRHSLNTDKGKTTERWRRKVTGLKD
jgi:hypothetical protein